MVQELEPVFRALEKQYPQGVSVLRKTASALVEAGLFPSKLDENTSVGDLRYSGIYLHPQFRYNQWESCIIIKDKRLHLTPTLNKIMSVLAENVNETVAHSTFYERVWSFQDEALNVNLRNHICLLRRIFRKNGLNDLIIDADWGVGYRLIDESKTSTEESAR